MYVHTRTCTTFGLLGLQYLYPYFCQVNGDSFADLALKPLPTPHGSNCKVSLAMISRMAHDRKICRCSSQFYTSYPVPTAMHRAWAFADAPSTINKKGLREYNIAYGTLLPHVETLGSVSLQKHAYPYLPRNHELQHIVTSRTV